MVPQTGPVLTRVKARQNPAPRWRGLRPWPGFRAGPC